MSQLRVDALRAPLRGSGEILTEELAFADPFRARIDQVFCSQVSLAIFATSRELIARSEQYEAAFDEYASVAHLRNADGSAKYEVLMAYVRYDEARARYEEVQGFIDDLSAIYQGGRCGN
ncbi:MAG: hypothetical protein K2X99_04640 [Gemmatimonadaceae bacterium]|nr:hypothetical protein [Gemmatimonadaceae bacterium]